MSAISLLIARVRLWWLFVRNTDGGSLGALRLAMWYSGGHSKGPESDDCHDCEYSGPCYCDEVINE